MTATRRKALLAGGFAALLILLWLTLSPWGAARYFRLRHELTELRATNLELTENNRALKEEIEKLKNDPVYLEKVAREQYDLLKKNEVIYRDQPKKSGRH